MCPKQTAEDYQIGNLPLITHFFCFSTLDRISYPPYPPLPQSVLLPHTQCNGGKSNPTRKKARLGVVVCSPLRRLQGHGCNFCRPLTSVDFGDQALNWAGIMAGLNDHYAVCTLGVLHQSHSMRAESHRGPIPKEPHSLHSKEGHSKAHGAMYPRGSPIGMKSSPEGP